MRKLYSFLFISVLVYAGSSSIISEPTGAPAGASGGPAESGITCTQAGCHATAPQAVTGYFTTDIPSVGYTAGHVYNISVSFTGTGKKGFQISPQDSIGGGVGTLLSGTGTQIMSTKYITHTAAKSTSTAAWTFQWRAPQRGKGRFSFYGAFAITKNSTKKMSIPIVENKSLPVSITKPATEVYNIIATINAIQNAKTGAYKSSFRYKAEGGAWSFVNSGPADISGDSNVAVKLLLSGLTPGTKYIYQACMWNLGDTTWGDSSYFITSLNSGLSVLKPLEEITVYPQPVTENFQLRYQLNQNATVKLSIYSLNGTLITTENLGLQESGVHYQEMNFNLAKGIYLLNLETPLGNKTIKFVAE